MRSTVFGSSSTSSRATGTPAQQTADDDTKCPPIDVREGASTIVVHGPGEAVGTNVRYQATVGELARECATLGATMTIKVGLQGRVLIGPVGGPGKLDVPVRFALVHEGPEPKPVWTKVYKVPVTIPSGQTNVSFTYVEDNMTFPKPSPSDLEMYVLYAGFDRAAADKATKPAPRSRRARQKSAQR